jgi:hypothetical protein
MSAQTTPDPANPLSLPAADAGTEVRLDDAPAPAYVDVSDGRPARKPVIPTYLRQGDGAAGLARGVRRHLGHQAVRHGAAHVHHRYRKARLVAELLSAPG